jgi:hypothetical protein
LVIAGSTLLLTCAAVALLNRSANPYSLFATDWLRSEGKPETFTHLRLVKAAQVRHLQPRGLILGSSRAETGLSPAHPSWRARPVYNLGLSDARIYEIQRYFQHACSVAPIEQAVLLLDYSAFVAGGAVAPDFEEQRLAVSLDGVPNRSPLWTDFVVSLVSWDALKGSLNTLSGRGDDKKYLLDGSRDPKAEDERVLAKGGAAKAFAAFEERALAMAQPGPKEIGQAELTCLRTILSTARAHQVDLRLAIAPMHVRYLEMLDLGGEWDSYEQWKREVLQIVEDEAAASGAAPFLLADFSGYNEFTAERVPERGLADYYLEASHFNMRLGDKLLTLLLGPLEPLRQSKPGGFGVLLGSANLAAQLQAIRADRDHFRRTRGAEIADLRDAMR